MSLPTPSRAAVERVPVVVEGVPRAREERDVEDRREVPEREEPEAAPRPASGGSRGAGAPPREARVPGPLAGEIDSVIVEQSARATSGQRQGSIVSPRAPRERDREDAGVSEPLHSDGPYGPAAARRPPARLAARPRARRAGGRGLPRRRGARPRERAPRSRRTATRRTSATPYGSFRATSRREC